jgi:hypothetical protein
MKKSCSLEKKGAFFKNFFLKKRKKKKKKIFNFPFPPLPRNGTPKMQKRVVLGIFKLISK